MMSDSEWEAQAVFDGMETPESASRRDEDSGWAADLGSAVRARPTDDDWISTEERLGRQL